MKFANLTDAQCRAYNDAVRHAAERAYREDRCIWVYRLGETFYVRATAEGKPEYSENVCIAQRWDDKTVQLRFNGAHSEWVKI